MNPVDRDRRDEIGVMAEAAEVFQRAMASTVELAAAQERDRAAKEHAEAEARTLTEANRQIAAVFNASPVALVLVRGDPFRVVTANDAAGTLFGLAQKDVVGLSILDLMVEAKLRGVLLTALKAGAAVRNFDSLWRTPRGRDLWCSVSAMPMMTDHGDGGMLLGIEDISERKWAEAQLRQAKDEAERAYADLQRTQESLIQSEKMASLSLLVAAVAHEINTPVGIGVTGASYLHDQTIAFDQLVRENRIKKSDLERYVVQARESCELILSNIGRAAELVQSFKQVAVDQTSAERRRFDLASYVQDVLTSLRPRYRQQGIEVSVNCRSGLEMNSYPGAVSQVLTNLVINAVGHGFDDGRVGRIEITVTELGDAVELRFSDTGKGIPKAHLSRIFEPFFTTKRGAGGTGLGLYVVFSLVTQTLQGRIAVDSEEGVGTTFVLTLPRTVKA